MRTCLLACRVCALRQARYEANQQPRTRSLGFFVVDLDSKADRIIVNRTVSLKENKPKTEAAAPAAAKPAKK